MRFNNTQRERNGDGGISRIAAGAQNIQARLRRHRMVGGNGAVLANDGGAPGPGGHARCSAKCAATAS